MAGVPHGRVIGISDIAAIDIGDVGRAAQKIYEIEPKLSGVGLQRVAAKNAANVDLSRATRLRAGHKPRRWCWRTMLDEMVKAIVPAPIQKLLLLVLSTISEWSFEPSHTRMSGCGC